MNEKTTHGTVPDPSPNVLDLVAAAILREDDLRLTESLRQDGLRLSDAAHIKEILALQSKFDDQLRKAESERLDAIRANDVGAVNRAAEVAANTAGALASQTAVLAETLRTQVAATATAGTVALAAALEPIQKDISDLRRSQYEAQGQKAQVIESTTKSNNWGMWIGLGIAALALGATLILGIAGVAVALILAP